MSNLRLINETSASSVTTVSVTDVFSSDFDIYKIVIDNFDKVDTSFEDLTFRFINASGSVITASNYDYAYQYLLSYSTFGEARTTNTDKVIGLGADDTQGGNGTVVYVFNPFSTSSYSFILWQGNGFFTGNGYVSYKGISVLKQTASMGGFQIFAQSQAQNINASVRTYGLRVDS